MPRRARSTVKSTTRSRAIRSRCWRRSTRRWRESTRAGSEPALVDSRQRRVDLRQHLLRMALERVVDFTVERARRGIAEMVVRPAHHLLRLVFERPRRLSMQILDRAFDARALAEQRGAETFGFHLQPFSPAEASSRSVCDCSRPSRTTIFSRDACPETSSTVARGTSSVFASSRSTASFARPSSGGSATRTFHASPWRPAKPGLRAPGETRSFRRVLAALTALSLALRGFRLAVLHPVVFVERSKC